MIDPADVKTEMYEPIKLMNGEMKQLGKTMIKLVTKEVYNIGASLRIGTIRPLCHKNERNFQNKWKTGEVIFQ
ncbi:hypothetical protein [Dyadobacter sp. 3J3]|uniref:hypothetical protein n=1 Tax=Dyadobacter sp. 3J3 TaxID=2606600 RepID=UPI00135CBFA3|nr:hypothetical protein [Dyadobacter sp. 3J3]